MSGPLGMIYDRVLAPLMITGFRMAALSHPKIREGLDLRRSRDGVPPWCQGPAETRPIWIHCASGEFEYAKPVIQELKLRDPEQKILVTYFSPSVRAAISKFPGVDFHTPAPWDRAHDIAALIDHHRPRALLIARTDTWPAMLSETRKRGIPSLLFSATLADLAGRLRPMARPISRWVFSQLTEIYCVSENDRARFRELGVSSAVEVSGDTRFDQVIERLRNPKAVKNLFTDKSIPVLVAGSTWDVDETELLGVMKSLKGRMRFVIAPHEPAETHLSTLETRLTNCGISFQRYSSLTEFGSSVDAVVVDQVGILAELYAQGDFGFVGGSFRKTVHSVMEPLGAGLITFVGPLHTNNREAIEFREIVLPRETLACVNQVNDAIQWTACVEQALATYKTNGPAWRQFIRDQIASRSGRSRQVVDWALAHRLP